MTYKANKIQTQLVWGLSSTGSSQGKSASRMTAAEPPTTSPVLTGSETLRREDGQQCNGIDGFIESVAIAFKWTRMSRQSQRSALLNVTDVALSSLATSLNDVRWRASSTPFNFISSNKQRWQREESNVSKI